MKNQQLSLKINIPPHPGIRLLLAICMICVAGCGGADWQAKTYPAYGIISINGAPPTGALVQLHPTGEAADVRQSIPWGLVKEDGTFSITTYEQGDGAPPGEYAMTIKWSPDVNTPTMADRLNNAYTDPAKSQWKITITNGDNELPPIDLGDAKVLSKDDTSTARKLPPGPEMGN